MSWECLIKKREKESKYIFKIYLFLLYENVTVIKSKWQYRIVNFLLNFNNSDFINTSLKDIDLSNSNIEDISLDLNCIKGAIISLEQTMDLIGLLGVKIKE